MATKKKIIVETWSAIKDSKGNILAYHVAKPMKLKQVKLSPAKFKQWLIDRQRIDKKKIILKWR